LDFPIDALDSIQSSVKPEHSKTPSFPQNVLENCGTLSPTLRAFASSREIFPPACVSRSADVRRLPPQYVRRGIPTAIHIRFHPPGEARQVPKSFPWAHWISLRGLPAIFQLRLIGLCVTLEGLLDTPERLIGSSPSFLGFGVILFESTTSFWGLPSDPLSLSKLMSQQATDTFDKNYLLWQPIS
jgi:hypothetical protein